MSEEKNEAAVGTSCCAGCGIAEIDDVKLKDCDDCDLVKYCSDECRTSHKSQHKKECKKRASELRDELLFKQPEGTNLGDCLICSLPMPLDPKRYITYECCSKIVCMGCVYANSKREKEAAKCLSCPFCRSDAGKFGSKKVVYKLRMKRVKANDPVAIFEEGVQQCKKGYYSRAFDYYTKSAELGYADAHFELAGLYHDGRGVEKDAGKEIHHFEEAAIGGHPYARVLLGIEEYSNNNLDRARKHWIISATQGYDKAIKLLMDGFKEGYVEKEVLAAALRAQKAALDETESPQRKAADEFLGR